MKWFSNLNIAKRLIISFLVVAFIAAVVGAVALLNITNINNADTALYKENTLGLQYVGTAGIYFQKLRYGVLKLTIDDAAGRAETMSKFDSYTASVDESLNSYKNSCITDDKDLALIQSILSQWEEYKTHLQKVVESANAGQIGQADQIITDMRTIGEALIDSLDKIMLNNETSAKQKSDSNSSTAATASLTMIIVIVIGVIISLILGISIARGISKPVNKLVDAADKLALGDINVNVEANTRDEIGKLAKSFATLIESTREQAMIAERLADADLSVQVKVRSVNDLLGNKLSVLVETLNNDFSEIASAAEQVATGSRQISDSSITLSQGATEQASSVQELTASLEEISSQTKLNAENADRANELAESAKTNAAEGNTHMKEMLKAMDEINVSSGNIYKIIKVIDDIAFQTNILALNAAVEAARAGQHGKGFAVVAEEVRNLAARSASAAKETADMIEGSIKKVDAGTRIAKDTAEALNKIVNEIAKAAELVNGIADASNEQASGINQINQGIMQVSEVIQTNSATSEESAAASEELSGQAQMLSELVDKFKLRKINKSYSKFGELDPEALRMLEELSDKKKTASRQALDIDDEVQVPKVKKIALSNKEFGKY